MSVMLKESQINAIIQIMKQIIDAGFHAEEITPIK